MSANNWRVCPQCKKRAEHEKQKRLLAAEKQYGKVSSDEYLRLLDKANKVERLKESLREDWEIGTHDDGEFTIYYACHCQSCGFSHEFNHNLQMEMTVKP